MNKKTLESYRNQIEGNDHLNLLLDEAIRAERSHEAVVERYNVPGILDNASKAHRAESHIKARDARKEFTKEFTAYRDELMRQSNEDIRHRATQGNHKDVMAVAKVGHGYQKIQNWIALFAAILATTTALLGYAYSSSNEELKNSKSLVAKLEKEKATLEESVDRLKAENANLKEALMR